MIHLDFDERLPDDSPVGHAISRREGVLISIITHAVIIIFVLLGGRLPWFQPSPEELEQRRQELEAQQQKTPPRFVFVEPLVDRQAPPRRPLELSDLDRRATAPRPAPTPANPLPRSEGNSAERAEAAPVESARGNETPPEPETPPSPPVDEILKLPPADRGQRRPITEPPRAANGALGDALRNLQRYVQNQTFHNPQGGQTDPGTAIQFDTKGVEFGPWIRRFVAQVRRNWFVPQAAWAFRGRVVLQFNIHRDGRITDVVVVQPSEVDAFNRASFNAILGSSPTEPLPPEYPESKAFFTVTFSYNEPLN